MDGETPAHPRESIALPQRGWRLTICPSCGSDGIELMHTLRRTSATELQCGCCSRRITVLWGDLVLTADGVRFVVEG